MDLSATVPVAVELPRQYNAATHFIDRHLDEGRANKLAFLDDQGEYTYSDLAHRVNQAAGALLGLGLLPEQRVLLCLSDTIDFPVVFWGAVKAGLIPVPVNTMLSASDYAYMLDDSRSRALIVSDHLLEHFTANLASRVFLNHVVVSGENRDGSQSLDALLAAKSNTFTPFDTTCDDNAFWLYTSGSTGVPKAAVHRHSDLVQTAELYGKGVLGLTEADRVFSAAKLFFAYGLGNAMSFPLHVGATAVLMSARPTPDAVLERLRESEASIFFGVPTLYGAILAEAGNDRSRVSNSLRLCVSAGEALPEEIGHEWQKRFGVPVLDGLGSTEMLHIFLSNSPQDVRYGTSGRPVPGYDLRIVDEDDVDISGSGNRRVTGSRRIECLVLLESTGKKLEYLPGGMDPFG